MNTEWTSPPGEQAAIASAVRHRIATLVELRAVIGEPTEAVRCKIADRIIDLVRVYIEQSPFVCLATSGPDGDCDVSPRGDPPGFVRILDDRTLLIPERPGNRLADTLRNIIANPHIGILFVLPGLGETFRVNGRAWLTTDPDLLAGSTVEGKTPVLGIVVEVEEAYTQCPKAFLRSDLWNPDRAVDRDLLPTGGRVLEALRAPIDADEYDRARAERYARRDGFY